MKARQSTDQHLVAEVAYAMLQRAAAVEPAQVMAERRVFDVLRAAYFADPHRALSGADGGGDQLKFGLPGVEELLTPVFLAASAEVVAYVVDRCSAASRRGVRRLLGLPMEPDGRPAEEPDAVADDPAVPQLTGEQWAQVRSIVAQALVRYAKMSPQRADLIAAAVVGDGITGVPPQ
ncbi:hypothetical protein [Micromonospora sp. KC721]|uniref:hypothetical protein n=1 Tax=Micromonospora sp. KC721 TaxID=2530380 RepID=UPI00104F4345|nr:hypothetical protein [Micromonospora sp. KC721]TDB81053.1 hypothetical protein E1182_06540 [Micromonospora sp. KC721]